jgi:transposase
METMISISLLEYEQKNRELEELRKLPAIVKALQAEIALLKGGRNSNTSSTAPSQDIGRSNKINLRKPSGKKPGGQPGHLGHSHPFCENPDITIDKFPIACTHCGENLDDVLADSYSRRQVVDIPIVRSHYAEYRSHKKICPCCGTKNYGEFPADVQAPIQYGPKIQATVGYLSAYQFIPYKRIKQLFESCFGLSISEGSIDNLLDKLAKKAIPVYENIKTRIAQSPVVGSDETGCRVNGKKHWFHVWQSNVDTFIVSFASRGYAVIEEYFKDGFIHSFYVSDCWASQLKVKAFAHQLCMAHLLRELSNFAQNLNSQWSAKMKNLFMRAIELKNKMTEYDYSNPPPEVANFKTELDELLQVDYSKFHEKEQAFVKRLIKHQQSVFTFLRHAYVPPDNNGSERAIRNVKVKTKVSGQFRNDEGKGADRYAKIRSVIDSAIKKGHDAYSALIELTNGGKVRIMGLE